MNVLLSRWGKQDVYYKNEYNTQRYYIVSTNFCSPDRGSKII
jgi:hypothetical protein